MSTNKRPLSVWLASQKRKRARLARGPSTVSTPRPAAIRTAILKSTETQTFQLASAYTATPGYTNQIGRASCYPVDAILVGTGLNQRDKSQIYALATRYSAPVHNGTTQHLLMRLVLLKCPAGYTSTTNPADSVLQTLFTDLNGNPVAHADNALAPDNFNICRPINEKFNKVLFDRTYNIPPGSVSNPYAGHMFQTPIIRLSGKVTYEYDGAPTTGIHPAYVWVRMFENVQNTATSVGAGALTMFKYKEI